MSIDKPNNNNAEEEIDMMLSSIPEEIADLWEERNTNKTLSEQKKNLEEFIQKRKASLLIDAIKGDEPSDIPTLKTNPLAIKKIIEDLEREGHEELGSGQAGRVISSERLPDDVCYKVMFPSGEVPLETNDIATEANLQNSIHELGEMFGVRVPEVFYFIHDGSTRAIAMERLNAITVEDMLSGKEDVPATYNGQVFYDAARKYVQTLHEKGYYHRDLHARNIMVDRKTGMPRFIDFGSSIRTDTSENVYHKSVIKTGQSLTIVLPSDLGSLDLLKSKLNKHSHGIGLTGVST